MRAVEREEASGEGWAAEAEVGGSEEARAEREDGIGFCETTRQQPERAEEASVGLARRNRGRGSTDDGGGRRGGRSGSRRRQDSATQSLGLAMRRSVLLLLLLSGEPREEGVGRAGVGLKELQTLHALWQGERASELGRVLERAHEEVRSRSESERGVPGSGEVDVHRIKTKGTRPVGPLGSEVPSRRSANDAKEE